LEKTIAPEFESQNEYIITESLQIILKGQALGFSIAVLCQANRHPVHPPHAGTRVQIGRGQRAEQPGKPAQTALERKRDLFHQ
jgi:hypothetical protein